MWLTVTTLLALLSGWFSLAARYPDRDEPAQLKLGSQSGMMGLGVSMSGILVLSACRSGLRIAIWRVFGPFCRPFFVPWDDIQAQPRQQFFQKMVRLGFGRPEAGVLSIDARAWERLSAQAGLSANDPRVLPPVPNVQLAQSLAVQWLVITCVFAAFFYFVPRLQSGAVVGPPLAVCILAPGIMVGFGQLIRYARQRR